MSKLVWDLQYSFGSEASLERHLMGDWDFDYEPFNKLQPA